MKADSVVVEEVRARALAISARYDHDLEKYAAHLARIEEAHAEELVNQVTVVRGLTNQAPSHQ